MSHNKGKTMKHEYSESQQMKTRQRLWPALIVTSQTTKTSRPSKTALHDPSARQQDKAAFGLWQFDDLQTYSVCLGRLCRLITRVSLIDERHLDMRARDFLDSRSQSAYLSPILLIGRRDQQGQQVAQRIHCRMHFAALAPLGSIVARSMSAFRARLQRSTVKNGGRRLFVAPLSQAQQRPQIVDNGLKDACFEPTLRLLIDRCERRGRSWGIMRHCAPVRTIQRSPLNTSRKLCSR